MQLSYIMLYLLWTMAIFVEKKKERKKHFASIHTKPINIILWPLSQILQFAYCNLQFEIICNFCCYKENSFVLAWVKIRLLTSVWFEANNCLVVVVAVVASLVNANTHITFGAFVDFSWELSRREADNKLAMWANASLTWCYRYCHCEPRMCVCVFSGHTKSSEFVCVSIINNNNNNIVL